LQLPQLSASFIESTQAAPHAARPAAQVLAQSPWLHSKPFAQALPQPPQFIGSDCSFTQLAPHARSGATHAHAPA
jgi:hypothetical protein